MNPKRYSLILISLFLHLFYFSDAQIPTRGLVAYYPFSGNANDLSGNLLHGQVNGSRLIMDRNGVPSNAYFFDGISNTITVNTFPQSWISGDFTISLWIKCVGNNTIRNYNSFISMGSSTFDHSFNFSFDNITPNFSYWDITNGSYYLTEGMSEAIGKWAHLTIIYTNNTMYHYVNGALKSTYAVSTIVPRSSNQLNIGSFAPDLQFFNGGIDDIRIYNRALSNTEISKLFNENKVDLSNGLQLHIPIQNDIKDYSTNKYTVSNTSIVSYSTNRYNQQYEAIPFSGSNYLYTNFKGIGGTSARSFSAWILPSNAFDIKNQYLLTYGPINLLNPSLDFYKEIRFGINFSNQNPGQKNLLVDIGDGAISYVTPYDYYDGKWHLVTYVIPDSAKLTSDIKMYLDCQLLTVTGNTCCTGTPPNQLIDTKIDQSNSYKVQIGVLAPDQLPASVTSFKGSMDDIRLYNRELNQNEVCALYNLYQPTVCNPTINTSITVLPTSGPMFYSIQKPGMDLVKISLAGKVTKIGNTGLPKSYNSIIGSLKFDKNKTLWYCGVGDSLFVVDTLSGKATFKTTLKHPTLNITNGVYHDAIAFNSNNEMYIWVEPIGPDFGKLFKINNLSNGTMTEISSGTIPNLPEILAMDFTKGDSLYALDQCCFRSFHIVSTVTGLPIFSSSSTNRTDITATSSYGNTIFGLNIPGYQNGTTTGFFIVNPATGNSKSLFDLPGQYVGLEAAYYTNFRVFQKNITLHDTIRGIDTIIVYVARHNSNVRKSTFKENNWKLNEKESILEWNASGYTIEELDVKNEKKKSIPLTSYTRIPLSVFTKGSYEVDYKTSDGKKHQFILDIE